MPCIKNQRILEIGCGTGVVTKAILDKLRCGDEFHIVELNSVFCQNIKSKIIVPFERLNSSIKIELHNKSIRTVSIPGEFDTIICGLPFNNFELEVVNEIFRIMFGLLKNGGELVYFEYLGARAFKTLLGTSSLRTRTRQRTKDINRRILEHDGMSETVWRNIPACRVVRLRV